MQQGSNNAAVIYVITHSKMQQIIPNANGLSSSFGPPVLNSPSIESDRASSASWKSGTSDQGSNTAIQRRVVLGSVEQEDQEEVDLISRAAFESMSKR